MDSDDDAYILSDGHSDFGGEQDVSMILQNKNDIAVDDRPIFGDSEASSPRSASPISVGEPEPQESRRPLLTSSRPFKQQKINHPNQKEASRSDTLSLEPVARIDPEEEADKKRIRALTVRIANKQFGIMIDLKAAIYIYSWLKANGLTKKSEESKSETAIKAICDRFRTKFAGSAKLDLYSLTSVVKEFDATYGLTEEGNAVTGANFNQDLNDSMNLLELQDQLTNDQMIDITKYLKCISAFKMAHLRYDKSLKTFVLKKNIPKLIVAGPEKAEAYAERYQLLKARVLRNEKFAPTSAFSSGSSRLELTPIKSLLGQVEGCFCLFGMLVQQVDETYAIADNDTSIQLKFMENCRYGRGLFTENCFILVEGEMTEGEIFNVHTITLPPNESRSQTESNYDHINWLGCEIPPIPSNVLSTLSAEFHEVSMVLISDVYLDKPVVLQGLRKLFSTLDDGTPLAIVMMGSFTSKPLLANGESVDSYSDGFKKLGNLVAEFTNLSKWCRFIMVPGPNDPVHINALPFSPLPKLYLEGFSSKVSNVVFTSNPARVQIADKQIVLMRHNSLNKTLRNVALPLPEKAASNPVTIQKYFARTIIDSGHLVPLPLNVQPILLAYDNALRLHCNPHLLVLSDETPAFSTDYKDTKFLNPGGFVPVSPNHSINYFSYFPFQDLLQQRCPNPFLSNDFF